MPLTTVRRPKYERQDVKQNLFSPSLSSQRLNKIQHYLKTKSFDGLLIILGIDGRFNSGSIEIFNYLMFDVFETRRSEKEKTKLDDDIFDDVMICIRQDEVHLYCNGVNYWLLLPYFAHWQGLQLHCISEIDMEDSDKFESFKVNSFVEIIRGCERIAVVTKASYEDVEQQSFNPMDVENWPIIQSFAHDDFGKINPDDNKRKKGFFTLTHEVVDVSKDIHRLCCGVDPVQLEELIQKVLPQIEGLFENIYQLLDTSCSSSSNGVQIAEQTIEEPVTSYYNHVRQRNSAIQLFNTYPFVLYGRNTVGDILLDRLNNESENRQKNLNRTVNSNDRPTHMIIQCVSFQTGIVEGRTVFLDSPTVLNNADVVIENRAANIRLLLAAYNSIVLTVEYFIENIKQTGNLKMNADGSIKYLKQLLKDIDYSDCFLKIHQCLENNDQSHGTVLVVQGVVFNISNDKKDNLGSILFADSFVVTFLPITSEENLGAILRIGKQIPLFTCWSNQNFSTAISVLNSSESLESIISDTMDVILIDSYFKETLIYNVCCTFYSDRLLLYHKRLGYLMINPKQVCFYEGESYDDFSILSIFPTNNEMLLSNLIWKMNVQNGIHLVLTNRGKFKKIFINSIYSKWSALFDVTRCNEISITNLNQIWTQLMSWLNNFKEETKESHSLSIIDGLIEEHSRSPLSRVLQDINFSCSNRKSCLRVFCQFMLLSYSLKYYQGCRSLCDLANVSRDLYLSLAELWKQFHFIDLSKLEKITPSNNETVSNVIVTVICGTLGSGQANLAKKITQLVQDNKFWALISPVTLAEVPSSMESILKKFQSVLDLENRKQLRIILLSPPFCSPSEIYNSVKHLSSQKLFTIGSVCVCIDQFSVYLNNHELTIPGLLDMCNEGWCNCILLTGSGNNPAVTQNLMRLLHARNELCTIFITPKANVNKELDVILSTTSFDQTRFSLARVLNESRSHVILTRSIDGVRKVRPGFYELYFPLYGLLSKEDIVKSLKEYFDTLSPCPFDGNIYFFDGVIQVEQDSSQMFSLTAISLTKSLSILPVKTKTSGDCYSTDCSSDRFVRIFGIVRDLDGPFDTANVSEIQLQKQRFLKVVRRFQRQKQPKKCRISRKDLSLEQINNIHTKWHLDSLPEGWFYNGLTYVHMDGTRRDKHPDLERFLTNFVDEENRKIDEYNETIDRVMVTDAFAGK